MTINEILTYVTDEQKVINEGLKFFKESKALDRKLMKYHQKIQKHKTSNPVVYKKLMTVYNRYSSMYKKIVKVEDDFKDESITRNEAKGKIDTIVKNDFKVVYKYISNFSDKEEAIAFKEGVYFLFGSLSRKITFTLIAIGAAIGAAVGTLSGAITILMDPRGREMVGEGLKKLYNKMIDVLDFVEVD